jgi:hypothetical protein
MSEITILLPHGEVDGIRASHAPRLHALRGKRIGFLDNGLWRSMRILADEFAKALTETHGIAGSEVIDSGPMHGARPQDYDERLRSLAARVDAVVSGLGN